MAKRPPRRKKAPSEAAKKTKKQIAMGRKEARQNRIVLILVVALIAVIVLIAAVGIISELIVKPNSPVAMVNGVEIRVSDYQDLVTYNRYNYYYYYIASLQDAFADLDEDSRCKLIADGLAQLNEDSLDRLIGAELARQKAEELQITVTEQEVDQAIETDFRSLALELQVQEAITGTEELVTPTPVAQEQVEQLYDSVLTARHLSEDAFRTIVRRDLMLSKVQDALAAEIPTTGLIVDLQLIETEVREEAIVAKARIDSGEDFAIVAQEVSTDTLTVDAGGAVGWVTPAQLTASYGAELEDYVFTLEVGEVGAVESNGMYYIVRVVDRDENGPLPDEVLLQRRRSALDDWLEERMTSPDVQIERLLQPEQIPDDPFASLFGC